MEFTREQLIAWLVECESSCRDGSEAYQREGRLRFPTSLQVRQFPAVRA